MRRRTLIGTVTGGLGVAVTGCLGGGSGEATVRLDAGGAIGEFERLQLGIGKVSLTPQNGEPASFTVNDTVDVANGPVTLVESKPVPGGTYTELSMTATVDRRELTSGDSPYTDLADLRADLEPLELSGGGSAELTMSLQVSKDEDEYRIEPDGVSRG